MKHFAPPLAVDLLGQAVARIRPDIEAATSLRDRARTFWAGVMASRQLGASDVVEHEFWTLAFGVGLIWNQIDPTRKGVLPYSFETVAHLIRWGMAARDPFGGGR